MILPIIIIVIGALLIAASIILRTKLGSVWMRSVLAAGILAALCGGVFTFVHLRHDREQRESVYLSLCYLADRQTEAAAFHLEQAEPATDCVTAFTRSLLEKMRGNELTARLNYDIGESLAKSDEEKVLAAAISGLDINDSAQLELVNKKLRAQLKLSEKSTASLELYSRAESGHLSLDDAKAAGLHENEVLRLEIGALLGYGNYQNAVVSAAALVEAEPSAENRLLLAEAVAESAYHGVVLSEDVFAKTKDDGSVDTDPSVEKERAAFTAQIEAAEEELASLELILAGTEDEDALKTLGMEKIALSEKIDALTRQRDKLFVYRAFTAIADIHTLEARLVRARLHFALEDYEKAIEVLRDSADSAAARMTADERLSNSLRIVEEAYESEARFSDTQEFRSAVTYLLSAPFSDLVYIRQSALTQDIVNRVVNDQKIYGSSLSVSGIDTSDYPLIRVTLTGREDVLREVVDSKDIVTRDTHQVVKYTAALDESVISDVCVVVDQSGSMSGQPMFDLKEALMEFVRAKKEGVSIAMVGFEDSYQLLNPLTTDEATLLGTINNLYASGGTNITAGIQGGIAALAQSSGNRIMLLMTDGQSGIDESVVAEAASLGIVIHTIGFGSVNHDLLEQIAEQTGGQYLRADSSSELMNIYATIQQIVGNVVTLEYTVTNTETVHTRYFFLDAGDMSIRREYVVGASGLDRPLLYDASPAIISPDDLQRSADQGSEYSVSFRCANILGVTAATVGGEEASFIELYGDRLTLQFAPQLSEGWQTVSLTLHDGSTVSFDRLLYVGSSRNYYDLRLGNLLFSGGSGLVTSDGKLLLTNTNIYDISEDGSSTLSIYVDGTLLLPWPAGETGNRDIDLGSSGTAEGWGLVGVSGGDAAYTSYAPAQITIGGFIIDCDRTQSLIIGEGGETK